MLELDSIAREVVEANVAPRAAVGFAKYFEGRWEIAVGGGTTSIFDLASLTKPMTAVAFARSGLDPRAPLAEYLPELASTPSGPLPVELFFAHRAGLAAHLPLFVPLLGLTGLDGDPPGGALGRIDTADALRIAAGARRDDAEGDPPAEGFSPVYSDLGYILAGAAMARALGVADAGAAIDAWVVGPLGLGAELGTARDLAARAVDVAGRAAPTEIVPWRGGAVVGQVHDENAWALTGLGGSGHAGIFGTIGAVVEFARDVAERASGLEWLLRERPGGTLRAGFDGKSASGSSAGERMGAGAFGHLGFTGTSFWIDRGAGIAVALLTNRVHPTRENVRIRDVRPWAHDELFAIAARGG